jgi:hypothetical protein
VLVTDLRHFLDLSEDAPGPARRLAEHLSNIVRAATAGDVGTAWESALPCRRRRPIGAAKAELLCYCTSSERPFGGNAASVSTKG